ncbi:MFS transporter [Streptomyces sp. AF1A]|uniref:MFS transporter n=1 Tax=Streptomyces sp. AF1A TaxID=3394350 RepID=UPI0039BD81E9
MPQIYQAGQAPDAGPPPESGAGPSGAVPEDVLDDSIRRRALFALGCGNTLEWYDWQVYGLLAVSMAPHFFPAKDPATGVLSAMAVFAVGFAARPLGGIVLGTVADRIGRKGVTLLSVGLMALASFVIAVLPGHDAIGVWSGVLLLFSRLVQGFSTGIEAPLSTAYAVELVPRDRVGRAAGTMSAYVNAGLFTAALVPFVLSSVLGDAALNEWAWRLPFALGGIAGIVIMLMRRSLPETLGRQKAQQTAQQAPVASPWRGVRSNLLGLFAIIFVVAAAQAFNYGWAVGLPARAQAVFHESPHQVFLVTSLYSLVTVVLALIVGRFADRVQLGRLFVWFRLLAIPVVFLILAYHGGVGSLGVILIGGGVVLAANMTLYNAVSASLMPQHSRGVGTGLGYAIGVALFGGTAPYLMQWLSPRGLYYTFPIYVAVLSAVSLVLYLLARRRGRIYL